MADLRLTAANDSFRPMSTVELALKVRPKVIAPGAEPVFALHPQYEAWRAANFPAERICVCPLAAYDRLVRPAGATLSLEEVDAKLRAEAARTGGYALEPTSRFWPRTAMFVVGATSCRTLVEFLFRWG